MDEHRIIRCCLRIYAVKTEAPETVLYTPDDLKDTPSMHDGSSGEWGHIHVVSSGVYMEAQPFEKEEVTI